jgi:hypothetical protein
VDTHNPGSLSLLLIGCALSAVVSLPVLAANDGVIVIERQVQPYAIGRARGTDPYPITANANPTGQIRAVTNELSDHDIAGISSGSSVTRSVMPNGDLNGLNAIGAGNSLGAASAAGQGGGSAGISGTVNGAVSRGLAPLNNLGGMIGGAMK